MTTNYIKALRAIIDRVRRDVTAIKVPEGGSRWVDEPLNKANLTKHLEGGLPRGCCPIKAGESTTQLALFDLDSHKGEVPWPEMATIADRITGAAQMEGVTLIPFRSSGGNGMHLFALWDAPQDAYSVRQLLSQILKAAGLRSGTKGVQAGEVEIFPKQNSVPVGGYGNQFILPLAGKSVPLSETFEPLPREAVTQVKWAVSAAVTPIPTPVVTYSGTPTTEFAELKAMLDAIPNTGEHELDYDQWRNTIFAIHHETGGSPDGLALAHGFSAKASKYDPDLLDNRIWPYITSDRDSAITGRTIAFLAYEHGYTPDVSDEFDVLPPLEDQPLKKPRFTPIQAGAFATEKPMHWLIKGVLPSGATAPVLAVMYGASGSGKSFIATDMAFCIALGIPWRNHKVKQGRVIYVCAEGSGGYRKRLAAYALKHGLNLNDVDMFVIEERPNLLQGDDIRDLIKTLQAFGPIALVVFDTLAQSTAGGNENSGEDMGLAISHCHTIAQVLRCTVMLVHHSGKDDTKGARGHSSLKAAADTELEVVRVDEQRAMRLSKQKDGEDGEDMGFALEVVPLGLDADGDPITSCVVTHNENTVAALRKPGRKLGSVEAVVMQTLLDGEELATGGMDRESLIVASIQKLEVAEGKRDRRREMVVRALDEMLKAKTIRNEQGIFKPEVST